MHSDNCRGFLAEYNAVAPNCHAACSAARRGVLRGLGWGAGPAPPSEDPVRSRGAPLS